MPTYPERGVTQRILGPRADQHPRARGRHRSPSRFIEHRGIVATVAVAAGAMLAAGTQSVNSPPAQASPADPAPPSSGPVQVLTLPKLPDLASVIAQLSKGQQFADERAARDAAARRPLAVQPVSGTLTSGFGPRWGTTHTGLDIANTIGTPIYAAADGTVVDAGPAQGFGLWVRIAHNDGTVTTYGHINEALVSTGQRVRAGEQIATVGNRGQSTGPHLHFEVTDPHGNKVDPTGWLAAQGVRLSDTVRS